MSQESFPKKLKDDGYIGLPTEILEKIFRLLPVETLMRGFDSYHDQYKVVKVITDEFNRHIVRFDILNIAKNRLWRQLKCPFSSEYSFYLGGCCHNNTIFWLIRNRNNANEVNMLELDLIDEVFVNKPFPKSNENPEFIKKDNLRWEILEDGIRLTEKRGSALHTWSIEKEGGVTSVRKHNEIQIRFPFRKASVDAIIHNDSKQDQYIILSSGGFREAGYHVSLFSRNGFEDCNFKLFPNLQCILEGAYRVKLWRIKSSLASLKEHTT